MATCESGRFVRGTTSSRRLLAPASARGRPVVVKGGHIVVQFGSRRMQSDLPGLSCVKR